MKSNYRQLAEYIREVKDRNSDGSINTLLGINIDKYFMPSVANVVGTDLTVYKIVKKGQFACNRMHVGRDKRLPVALSRSDTDFIVSPAYDVFEIIDESVLNPEYLMMWFSRKEFDRNAWFYTDADVRGGLSWDAFCNMQLPVPAIEMQKEIVKEYNTIVKRIKLNEQLNRKLEETAQAIYRQWFVDFEFPDANGNPYKSSGGEMVWNEELEKDIPKGWEVDTIISFCDITSSKRIFHEEYEKKGIPFYRGKEVILKKKGKPLQDVIYISNKKYSTIANKFGKPEYGDILLTAVGTLGISYFVQDEDFYFKDGNIIWFKNFKKPSFRYLIYDFMQSKYFFELIQEITIGSTQNAITIDTIGQKHHVLPPQPIRDTYYLMSKALLENGNISKNMNTKLDVLENLVLSNIAKDRN